MGSQTCPPGRRTERRNARQKSKFLRLLRMNETEWSFGTRRRGQSLSVKLEILDRGRNKETDRKMGHPRVSGDRPRRQRGHRLASDQSIRLWQRRAGQHSAHVRRKIIHSLNRVLEIALLRSTFSNSRSSASPIAKGYRGKGSAKRLRPGVWTEAKGGGAHSDPSKRAPSSSPCNPGP